MDRNTFCGESPTCIAVIGNHLPRQCGISTFTTDLLDALYAETPNIEWLAMVMKDIPGGYPYPLRLHFELDYRNMGFIDVQRGPYFGEDNVERLEEDYGRS